MTDIKDALGEEAVTEDEAQAESTETEEAEPEAAEASTEEEAEAPEKAADPEPEPEKAEEPEHTVPVGVVQELRRELRELKEAAAAHKVEEPKPEPLPDVIENQEGFVSGIQNTVQRAVLNERLNMSEVLARQQHGDEVVTAAFEAMKAAKDGPAYQAIMSSANPYGELVKWHRRQEVSREIGDDPNSWREQERARIRAELEAEMATKQIKESTAQPAPSLAKVTGGGGKTEPEWAGPKSLGDLLPP